MRGTLFTGGDNIHYEFCPAGQHSLVDFVQGNSIHGETLFTATTVLLDNNHLPLSVTVKSSKGLTYNRVLPA